MMRLRLFAVVPAFAAAGAALAGIPVAGRSGTTAPNNPPANAVAPQRYDDIMPVSQLRPGMTGYGLTVFRGTKIERFDVTIVGVVKKGSLVVPGHDMILVKMAGGPMTQRSAYLIRGMSGSPVYIHGKIIGAFSMGEPLSKEPLGGVTPIEDMLEAWDPKLPDSPTAGIFDNKIHTALLPAPITAGTRTFRKVVSNVPLRSGLRSHDDTLVLHPCTTFMTFSTTSKAVREKLAKALEPYNVELVQGIAAGQKPGFTGSPLLPGSAFSMMLVTGDLSAGATGTVSYRRDNRLLGFGHPFMGIGPIEAPLCSAWIYDVYPLVSGSYKISSPGPVVGASTQDRNFSVSGIIGKRPHTIPVTVEVRDLSTGRSRTFHSQTINHPNLYAAMVSAAAGAAVAEVHPTPGPAMARLTTTVDADEIGKVTRTNIVYDARGIDGAATGDLDDMLSIFTSNPFYPLGIKSADVKVEIDSGRKTAQVERIFLKEGRFEPGETAEVGIVIKPYKEPSITKTVRLQIPSNTPSGRYILQVRGGALPGGISFGGLILRPQNPSGAEQAPPVSIRQMVNRLNEREKNNDIVARILLPTMAVNVDGEHLSNLPPSIDATMRSAKSSGVRLERDEVKQVIPTDWVISGQQLLSINVQRKDNQEGPSGPSSGTSPSAGSANAGVQNGAAMDQEFSNLSTLPAGTDRSQQLQNGSQIAEPDSLESAPEHDSDDQTSSDSKASPAVKPDRPDSKAQKKTDKKDATKTASVTPALAPAAPAEAVEKPVGRQPITWRQTTRGDFAKGESAGVSVTSGGDLCLTRTLAKLQSTAESFIWSIVSDGAGGLYAGTGTGAKILHFDSQGKQAVWVKLPEISVQSIYRGSDGTLWAATGPNGRIYKIKPDGSSSVALDTNERYALAVTGDSAGNVYAGTGGGRGNIYRIKPDGTTALFFRTPEEHVLSLAVDKAGNLLAGTAGNGLIYRITPNGKGAVLYDAAEASITALGVNSKGDVYASTAPRGVIYRIGPDGAARSVYEKVGSPFTAMRVAADDTVYAAGGSSVVEVRPDDTAVAIGNRTDIDILSLAIGDSGSLYAGTGNVAEIYCASPSTAIRTGTYDSVIHDAKQTAKWGSVRWTAAVPAGTTIKIQTRTGNVAEPDSSWSSWTEPRIQSDGGRIMSPASRYIQYRVKLDSATASISPTLRDISITYLAKNQPPKVTFASPAGGERWSRQQTVKWDANDPDRDTLSYEVFYSADHGQSWTPLPGAKSAADPKAAVVTPAAPTLFPQVPTPAQPASAAGTSSPPSVSAVQAELDKHPDLPATLRDAILERARRVNANLQQNQAATASAVSASAPGVSAPIRETSRSVDTKLLPDGVYVLKVVTTDRPSNPVDPRSSEVVSEPFIVCNSAPTVFILKASTKIKPDRSVSLEGTALQTLIPITAVQFRIDGGEWTSAVPQDGIFDGAVENFAIDTAPLTAGKHTIEVKAFNAANTTSVEKVEVEVK